MGRSAPGARREPPGQRGKPKETPPERLAVRQRQSEAFSAYLPSPPLGPHCRAPVPAETVLPAPASPLCGYLTVPAYVLRSRHYACSAGTRASKL